MMPPDAGPADECAGAAADTLLCKPMGTFPKTIKGTGFFTALPDFGKHSTRR
jgi:hypothetical protein